RLKKLWVRLSYLRADVYTLFTAIGKRTTLTKEQRENASEQFWVSMASAVEPKVAKLERVSAELASVTTLMLASFRVVCAKSKQTSLDALKLFTENDPNTLQWQMKEDAVLFAAIKVGFNNLRGEKFELNRICERGNAAVDAIMNSNIAIFGACEAVID